IVGRRTTAEGHPRGRPSQRSAPRGRVAVIRPGEIYVADLDQAGPHPVIVVSREELNRGQYALVAVCTSARFALRSTLSNCVPFRAGQFGFTVNCVAECDNILSMEMAQLD